MGNITTIDLSLTLRFDISLLVVIPAGGREALESNRFFDDPSVQADLQRLATSIARTYTDESCVFLHTDELEAECRAKLSKALANITQKAGKSRANFFALAKTVMKNHVRSLVQRHRFTHKRTGVKPPPRHARNQVIEMPVESAPRPVREISLDDEDAHMQVGEESEHDQHAFNELVRDITDHCNPLQRLVFEQLNNPNMLALNLARLEATHGKRPEHVKVNILRTHLAAGLGITVDLFEETVLEIQKITIRVREMKPEDLAYENALAALGQLFQLQIPKATPRLVVSRMLTLAARDNHQKVTSHVEDLLTTVGAAAPKFNATTLACHGVLYQRGHRICENCGLKESCRNAAANIGLGEITISPKLLGAKLQRTAYVVPQPKGDQLPTANERDYEIIQYLFSNFRRVSHRGDLYFQPKEFTGKQKLLFCVGDSTVPLVLQFRSPSQELRKKLELSADHYCAPAKASAQDVINLINEHTKQAYAQV